MKKCAKCQIVYHTEARLRCLYCDSRLVTASVYDGLRTIGEASPTKEAHLKNDKNLIEHGHLEYLVGAYFQVRSFHFSYIVSRQDFKMGKQYKRKFIQPFNFTAFMKIPWVVVDIVDSLLFRLVYRGFCDECSCKYIPGSSKREHPPEACEYNKEYAAILDNIRSGKIVVNDDMFREQARKKEKLGQRSAYQELCARKTGSETLLDLATILMSLTLIFLGIIWAVMPLMNLAFNLY